jgi:hypothetical protein
MPLIFYLLVVSIFLKCDEKLSQTSALSFVCCFQSLFTAGTDGGRISLTLFGRSGTQFVGFITLVGMFLQGVFGSDLILFFFSFVIFFQSELEIPQRNEVDDMDYSRALLATATGFLVLLTVIPM